LKVSAIIPAYNEEKTIKNVLAVLASFSLLDEIIVVDDGSTDQTAKVVRKNFPQVKLITLPKNKGKADALITGAKTAKYPVLFFCDADLINLRHSHLKVLIKPVLNGKMRMMVGAQENMATWKENRAEAYKGGMGEFIKGLGGEKVLLKKDFFKIPGLSGSNYGIEHLIINYFKEKKLPFNYYVLKGTYHVLKIKKWGIVKGSLKELESYITFGRQWLKRTISRLPQDNFSLFGS